MWIKQTKQNPNNSLSLNNYKIYFGFRRKKQQKTRERMSTEVIVQDGEMYSFIYWLIIFKLVFWVINNSLPTSQRGPFLFILFLVIHREICRIFLETNLLCIYYSPVHHLKNECKQNQLLLIIHSHTIYDLVCNWQYYLSALSWKRLE